METPLVIVGPGRLGRSAAHILQKEGVPHVLVGRGQPIPSSPLTWLTVPDREIQHAAELVPKGGVVLHASGAMDMTPLQAHENAGSLHPLMTFPGPEFGLPTEETIPAAIAGNTEGVRAARALATVLGFTPFEVSGDRALYHAAAVISGNFASVLLCEAARILEAAGAQKGEAGQLLMPLALASIRSAAQHGPGALTGPIARGDEEVIRAHAEAIEKLDPALSTLYTTLADATRRLKS